MVLIFTPCYTSIISCHVSTVWKFHDFSITQILREINFAYSKIAKSAISSVLEALNLDYGNFCPSNITKNCELQNSFTSDLEKWNFLRLQSHRNCFHVKI